MDIFNDLVIQILNDYTAVLWYQHQYLEEKDNTALAEIVMEAQWTYLVSYAILNLLFGREYCIHLKILNYDGIVIIGYVHCYRRTIEY